MYYLMNGAIDISYIVMTNESMTVHYFHLLELDVYTICNDKPAKISQNDFPYKLAQSQ